VLVALTDCPRQLITVTAVRMNRRQECRRP
jgi:hypothetical protein